jgi:hypothetical protein
MTQEELILFKELLKETIRSTVKETIKEELSGILKKDMKDVKLLLAKSIKESMALRESGNYAPNTDFPQYDRSELKQRIREAVGGDEFRDSITSRKKSPLPMMSEEQAVNISVNGQLPDFDAPIPMMKKDSIAWKEMQERIM